MSAIDQIERQPTFPAVDLTDINAFFLGLMLANAKCLGIGHKSAEIRYPIFSGTHPALRIATEKLLAEENQVKSVEFGIIAFEAITAFVDPDPPIPDLLCLEQNINGLVNPNNKSQVGDYFADSHTQFRQEMPRTAVVIEESASSYGVEPRLAVFGGAVARRFELHNVAFIES
ncbi:MAG: hypothetical protein WBO35_04655 [Candidatus Saccharimonadales bacterium]